MAPALETEEQKIADGNGGGPRGPDYDDPDGRHWGDDGGQDNRGRPYIPGIGLLAMRFVLVSVAVLFITVGIAYFERSRSGVNWQHIQIPRLLWLSTALILASGWALEIARGALERKSNRAYMRWLEITLGFGVAFLGSQLLAPRELVGRGIYLRHNPHSSLFYVVTGAHGLHLLGGMAALSYLLIHAALHPELIRINQPRQRSRTAVCALYWHFLSILWLGLFLFLLLWP